jgi:3D (Asp-Asp-Asp) domain-containing protein
MSFIPVKKTLAGLAMGLSIAAFTLTFHTVEASAATTYTTQENDTFWTISRNLNVPLQDLMNANPDINPLNVYAGLTMKLPDSVPAFRELAAEKAAPIAASEVAASPKAAAPAIPADIVKTASGEELHFDKTVSAVATAYTDTPGQNGSWGNVDYFGNPLKLGTIAVDPSVIPLGTKVYVTGYTFDGLPHGMIATAADMGGAIKGNRIDIFVPSTYGNVEAFGMQNVTVYELK